MIRRIIKTNINFFESHNFRFSSSVSKQSRLQDKSPIIITAGAASRINDLILSKNPIPLGLRIGIRKRGCNGLSFTMNYVMDTSDTKKNVKDIIVKADNGVCIYIDHSAIFNIVGTVMDWKDDEISSEFTFLNPKSKGSCGCGESFNI